MNEPRARNIMAGRRQKPGRRQASICATAAALSLLLVALLRYPSAYSSASPPRGNGPIDPQFQYSLVVSTALDDDRSLPDVRPATCKHAWWFTKGPLKGGITHLPGTSVVIVEVNEAEPTLRRTITSVINRSPPSLLHEVIVVDDCSDWPVSNAVRDISKKIMVLTNMQREGVVRSRLRGFAASTAQTVTFLDAHVEVNTFWLEPLLERVALFPSTIVAPVIDVIHPQSFAYHASAHRLRGGFDWDLNFRWVSAGEGTDEVKQQRLLNLSSEKEASTRFGSRVARAAFGTAVDELGREAAPVPTPAIAGGLFTVDRAFFKRIGAYDPDFEIWGSENLELSFRAWMCGGRLEVLPCSRVGHVFRRESPLRLPNGSDASRASSTNLAVNFQLRNKLRTALVWMDGYARFVAAPKVHRRRRNGDRSAVLHGQPSQPFGERSLSPSYAAVMGNVSERVALRSRLQCRSFQWYLDTVWPDHEHPVHPMRVQHRDSGLCVEALSGRIGQPLELRPCSSTHNDVTQGSGQVFELVSNTAELRLRTAKRRDALHMPTDDREDESTSAEGELCWRPSADGSGVELGPCGRAQRWGRTGEGQLTHLSTRRCLTAHPAGSPGTLDKANDGRTSGFHLKLEEHNSDVCLGGQWRWVCNGAVPPPPFVRVTADEQMLGAQHTPEDGAREQWTVRSLCSTQRLHPRRRGSPSRVLMRHISEMPSTGTMSRGDIV